MNKETFMELLTNHTPEELNQIIQEKGKRKLMEGLIFEDESNKDVHQINDKEENTL